MYFESFSDALAMDGHGFYVWSAYAITFTVLVVLLSAPWRRQRRILRELRGEIRRRERTSAKAKADVINGGDAHPDLNSRDDSNSHNGRENLHPASVSKPQAEAS